jgi:hypothetical protein
MKHVRITALLMAISDTGLAESGHSTAAGACKERNARGRSSCEHRQLHSQTESPEAKLLSPRNHLLPDDLEGAI